MSAPCRKCGATEFAVRTRTKANGSTYTTRICRPCRQASKHERKRRNLLAAVAPEPGERLPSHFFGGGGGFDSIAVYPHPLELWEVEG